MSESQFTIGSLYLAGLAQAVAPHTGLLIPSSDAKGHFVHIKVDPETRVWVRESRTENIRGSMALTTLLKLRDVSDGVVTPQQLDAAAALVDAPEGGEFGECLPWVLRVVKVLWEQGFLKVTSVDDLAEEFREFAQGNRKHARRDVFPNVKSSAFVS